jgi:hypothetical protein
MNLSQHYRINPSTLSGHRMNLSFTEDTLVQQTTAAYLQDELGWDSVYAYNNEDFGPNSLLGRKDDGEVVLIRDLRAALVRLNPGLPDAVDLLETLKAEKLRIDRWQDKEATRDAVFTSIRDFLWSEQTGLPVDAYSEDDVRDRAAEVYRHIFRVYPRIPSPVYSYAIAA